MKRVLIILLMVVLNGCVAKTPARQIVPTAPVPIPTSTSFAQPLSVATSTSHPIIWEKQFDNQGNADIAWDVVETVDWNLVIVGATGPTPCQIGCNWDGWIIKIDPQGGIIWTCQVGGKGADLLTSVILKGNGYLVTGSKYVLPDARQAWLLEIAPDGEVIWEKTLGGNQDDSGTETIATPDGNFLMIGQTKSFGAQDGKSDVWLVKLNAKGEVIWTKTYDLGSEDMGTSLIPYQKDRYILTAVTCTANCGGLNQQGYASYLVTDANGNILKRQTFDEGSKNKFLKIKPTGDGGAVIVGATSMQDEFPSEDTWVVRLDANADVTWTRILNSYGRYDGGFDIVQMSDGGYVIAAYSQIEQTSQMNFDNFWMVRLSSTGETLESHLWGGPDNDDAYSVILTADGGIVLAGFRDAVSWPLTAVPGPSNFYVIKTTDDP